VGKPEQNRLKDLNIEGWVLKWTFNKWDKGHGLNWCASGQGQVGSPGECNN